MQGESVNAGSSNTKADFHYSYKYLNTIHNNLKFHF